MKQKLIFILVAVISVTSCSTEKNTASRRFYHNLTTKYNIYFNGYTAFNQGIKKIDETNESFVQLLPVYKGEPEEMYQQAASDMDRAIQKSVKAIKTHSITAKPELKNTGGRLTPEQEAFLNKTEYNKWIDDAYLLIGKSHYYKGEYRIAMKSLQTILTKFRTEDIRFDAMYWIARSYSALNETRDAENYINKITESPEYNGRLEYEIQMLKADIAVKQKRYSDAIDLLKPLTAKTKKKNKKARLNYILAQLYAETGDNGMARIYYEKVIKLNPSYDMVFSSKIRMAESYETEQGNSDELKKSLRKMLKDDKNIDYRDQIYYALAKIDIKEGNKVSAEKNYLESARLSTTNQNQKALSFLALADLYFERPEYLKASAYYDSTMSILSRDYKDYTKISAKAENLRQLTDNLKIVAEEDSLQRVARMGEDDRMNLINNLIAQVKADEAAAKNTGAVGYDPFRERDYNNQQNKGKWLFYNPQALSIGKNEFIKTWGNRKNEDHWRRSNKTVISNPEDGELTDNENKVTDNKDPEFYLQNLPLTDSAMAVSEEREAQALFAAAYTYENNMKAYDKAIETYNDFLKKFPKHNLVVECYFNLYMIYFKELNKKTEAEKYRQKILNEFPNSKYANILSDPNYLDKLKKTKDRVNELYEACFTAYKNEQYAKVLKSADEAAQLSPQNDLIPGFLYFRALAYGNLGDRTKMQTLLAEIVEKYPQADITAQAQKTLDVLNSGKYDPNYYQPAAAVDSFYYVIITASENKDLLNKMKFLLVDLTVELFPANDIRVSEEGFEGERKQIIVRTFKNREKAAQLFTQVEASKYYKEADKNSFEHFYISKSNYNKLLKLPIPKKYLEFFNRTF